MKYLGIGFNLLMRTLPILGVRVGATLLFGLALILYLTLAAGLAWLAGHIADWLGIILFIVALISILPIYNLARSYVFYLLKAAHVAVMVELLEYGQLPPGQSQLDWGKAQVKARFGDTNAMFVIDKLVTGIVAAFTNSVTSIVNWLPLQVDGLNSLMSLFRMVVRYATDYVDEAILGRAYIQREQNVWQVSKDGIILYGMVWKPILKNALGLALISFISVPLYIVILAIPAILLAKFLPIHLVIAAVIILAIALKVAATDSLSLASTIAAYHMETRNLVPNPEWEARFDNVSDKFRELKEHAAGSTLPVPTMLPVAQKPMI